MRTTNVSLAGKLLVLIVTDWSLTTLKMMKVGISAFSGGLAGLPLVDTHSF